MKGIGHASFTDADLLFGAYTAKLTPWVPLMLILLFGFV